MADYISREAALRVLCDACGNAACPKGLIPRCSYYEKMQSIPAADVVPMDFHERCLQIEIQKRMALEKADVRPVVLCKDCKWYEINELKKDGTEDRRYKPSVCMLAGQRREPNHFCADGKKREKS